MKKVEMSDVKVGDSVKFRNGNVVTIKSINVTKNAIYPYIFHYDDNSYQTFSCNGLIYQKHKSDFDIVEIIKNTDMPTVTFNIEREKVKLKFPIVATNEKAKVSIMFVDNYYGVVLKSEDPDLYFKIYHAPSDIEGNADWVIHPKGSTIINL